MGMAWYDAIARRNGGYRSNAVFIVEGLSAETVFEQKLTGLLREAGSVLDAGCGHGDFTLRMAGMTSRLTGFDFSEEMIRIAKGLQAESGAANCEFIHATTKRELPFGNEEFDLIYSRRGPTSIIQHPRLLKPGGRIIGIHTDATLVKERLPLNGFTDIQYEEYEDAMIILPDEEELCKFLSGIPGNPDYSEPGNRQAFQELIPLYTLEDNRLGLRERRTIWSAVKG